MQSFPRKHFLIAWLVMSALAVAVCSLTWPAAHLGEEYLPVSNDAFYHARRILDTAQDPGSFYEFDAKIHAPEGSLLVWPWGYDYAMAMLVRAGMGLGIAQDPMAILIWLPVAAVLISIGLIMLTARRMSLSLWSCMLAALCVAISPLTQYLHGVGFVDHHFAEYIFVLATIAAGLKWLTDLANVRAAVVLGVVLGLAPAVHNALFILQLPVLAALFILWLQGIRAPQHATTRFAAALLAATGAILIPSLPFQQGFFEYYLLSWFQLYVAAGTVVCCCLFSYKRPNRSSIALLAAFAALSLLPLAYQISMAGSFLTGELTRLDAIGEMQSVPQIMRASGVMDVTNRYSQLLWLLPATLLYCLAQAWQERANGRLFFWVCAVCGLPLLFTQFRLHYYGSFALCIPWLVAIEHLATRFALQRRRLMLATTLLLVLAYGPTMRNQLLGPIPVGNDEFMVNIRPGLRALAKACERDPGVVLADNDIGHYIRFFTKCSVIANNFLLTQQHGQKILQMEALFRTSAQDLPRVAPFVKYVLVRPAFIREDEHGLTYVSYSTSKGDLIADLLLRPTAVPPVAPPAEYQLLHQSALLSKGIEFPYLRVYKIHGPPLTDAAAR